MSGTQDVVIAAGGESMSRVPMFSNYTLHGKEGVGVGPFSARVQERFGVPAFSQFDGAEMIAQAARHLAGEAGIVECQDVPGEGVALGPDDGRDMRRAVGAGHR